MCAGAKGEDGKIVGSPAGGSPTGEEASTLCDRPTCSGEGLPNAAVEVFAPPYNGPLTKFTYQRAR